jgi:hypothetical protein
MPANRLAFFVQAQTRSPSNILQLAGFSKRDVQKYFLL